MSSRSEDSTRMRIVEDNFVMPVLKLRLDPEALAFAYRLLSEDMLTRAFMEDSQRDRDLAEKDWALSEELDRISSQLSPLTEEGREIYARDLAQFKLYGQGASDLVAAHLEASDGPVTYEKIFTNLPVTPVFGKSRHLRTLRK